MTTPAMQPTSSASSAERAMFEAWYLEEVDHRANFKGAPANVIGWYYFDADADLAWSAWQAASTIVPQVVQAPIGWRGAIEKIMAGIGAGDHPDRKTASYEAELVRVHMDCLHDELEALEQLAAPIVATGDLSTVVPSAALTDERAAFIKWTEGRTFNFKRSPDGGYYWDDLDAAWQVWQALANTAQGKPEQDSIDAKRYQWLRENGVDAQGVITNINSFSTWGDELDAATDAALAAKKG